MQESLDRDTGGDIFDTNMKKSNQYNDSLEKLWKEFSIAQRGLESLSDMRSPEERLSMMRKI